MLIKREFPLFKYDEILVYIFRIYRNFTVYINLHLQVIFKNIYQLSFSPAAVLLNFIFDISSK